MSAENIRNTYRRQGAQAERERIIKLLEQTGFTWYGTKQNIDLGRDELIALIKGENK